MLRMTASTDGIDERIAPSPPAGSSGDGPPGRSPQPRSSPLATSMSPTMPRCRTDSVRWVCQGDSMDADELDHRELIHHLSEVCLLRDLHLHATRLFFQRFRRAGPTNKPLAKALSCPNRVNHGLCGSVRRAPWVRLGSQTRCRMDAQPR